MVATVGVMSYKLWVKDGVLQSLVPVDGKAALVEENVNLLNESELETDQDYYYNFFKKKGLTITSFNYEDLTGEGRQAVFNTIGAGCGSCHYNEIHVFQGTKEIFVFYGEDSSLDPIDGKGFKITQPVLKQGQSYAERSKSQWATYKWDGRGFVKTMTSPNWVDEPQTPG